jgi:hypothetical protein
MRLKLILICLLSLFIFGFSLDEENISVDVARTVSEAIEINWDIAIEEYEIIFLEISHNDSIDRYELIDKSGRIEMCCFPGEVKVTIIIQNTTLAETTDSSCEAETCVEFKTTEYYNSAFIESIPSTTIQQVTTTTTTTTFPTKVTTTIPQLADVPGETKDEITSFFQTEINNPLIKNIPLFSDINFNDQQQNALVVVISTITIFLFYLVLIIQEWFNKLLGDKTKDYRKHSPGFKSKLVNSLKTIFVLVTTAFLLGYVEEGANLTLDTENLAIFLAAFVGLIVVTFSYEGIEGLIEKFVHNQMVMINWSPQAIFFALLSTLTFVFFDLPIGFIFGFFATTQIIYTRSSANISPKFFSSIFLVLVGYLFFYMTSSDIILNSPVFTAISALTYLMCLEGAVFKCIPGGGNELIESIKDSKGPYKLLSLISFFVSVWLFIRILILPDGSEFFNMQEELISLGPSLLIFLAVILSYIFILLIFGLLIKRRNKIER